MMPSLTAGAIAAEVNARRKSARHVAEMALERVAHGNGAVNAFAHLDPALTLSEADSVDARLAVGERLALAGVPVVIKDNIWVAGRSVTQGSRLFEGFRPPQDAQAVARLRAAGAVILGIGTCSEFACKGVTSTQLHGITRNPCDLSLTPGGSSGGPAAAIAAGFAPLALGTDAGGSGRRPAAHTGTVGLKPTQDAIPYGPGFDEPFWNISVLAPMAGCVDDVALMFQVLSGTSPTPLPDRPLRIALTPSMGLSVPMDDAAHDTVAAAALILRADGHQVTEASPDWPAGFDQSAPMALQWAGLAALYGERWLADPDSFDHDLGVQIAQGLALSGADVARALDAGATIQRCLRSFVAGYDLILGATTPCPAWPVGQLGPALIGRTPAGPRDHAAFTAQYNHAGLPALSLPCGRTATGLPMGVQLGAGPGRDGLLLAAAARLEHCLADAGPSSIFDTSSK